MEVVCLVERDVYRLVRNSDVCRRAGVGRVVHDCHSTRQPPSRNTQGGPEEGGIEGLLLMSHGPAPGALMPGGDRTLLAEERAEELAEVRALGTGFGLDLLAIEVTLPQCDPGCRRGSRNLIASWKPLPRKNRNWR